MSPPPPSKTSSSLAILAAGLLLAAACGKSGPPVPEADPALVKQRADTIMRRAPNAGSVRVCEDADVAAGLTMTQNTLLRLAGAAVADDPEHAAWLHPTELDAPSARTLLDPAAKEPARRAAAAEWLAAPSYLVYRIDNTDAPLALGVKELKRGTIGARLIRHDRSGAAVCTRVFLWQNSKERSDWAIQKTDRAVVDPEVAAALQADLREQYLLQAPGPKRP
jgi:hypothetical protein